MIRGTQGYAEQADELVARYESVAFADKHAAVLHLLPAAPAPALDVGAGTGADAAWLAERGHPVVAVEPTAEFRKRGGALHPSASIEWIDDSLPMLAEVRRLRRRFGLVMLTAVWMHLDEPERRIAMPRLAALLAPGGVLVMALRHGTVPAGRVMFEVSAEETVALAEPCGLRLLLCERTESTQPDNRAAGITWTRLAFLKPVPGALLRTRGDRAASRRRAPTSPAS
jgi:SAM-dependent methyltransferase